MYIFIILNRWELCYLTLTSSRGTILTAAIILIRQVEWLGSGCSVGITWYSVGRGLAEHYVERECSCLYCITAVYVQVQGFSWNSHAEPLSCTFCKVMFSKLLTSSHIYSINPTKMWAWFGVQELSIFVHKFQAFWLKMYCFFIWLEMIKYHLQGTDAKLSL